MEEEEDRGRRRWRKRGGRRIEDGGRRSNRGRRRGMKTEKFRKGQFLGKDTGFEAGI